MVASLLLRYPLLQILPHAQLASWIEAGHEFKCDSGTTLFQEDSPGAWLYLVREGRIRILRQRGAREITLGMLQPGDLIGDYALLPPGRNTATCRAAAPSVLLCLPLGPLRTALTTQKAAWKNLKNWLRLHTLLHFYRGRAFLGFMSAESGLKFLDRLKPANFAAGQTLQANGLAAETWYVIERGTVHICSEGQPEVLGPGDSFGAGALLDGANLPTALAHTDVCCQMLGRHEFDPTAPAWSKVAQSYRPEVARPAAHIWVPQLERSDCGLAALAMVGLRLGLAISVEELRRKAAPGPDGLSLQQLRDLATEIGLACQAARVSADRLGQVSLPALVHLEGGHYVVLHEFSATGAVVGDPAAGIVTWSAKFLSQRYSGSLLLFDMGTGARGTGDRTGTS